LAVLSGKIYNSRRDKRMKNTILFLLLLVAVSPLNLMAQGMQHPLDPLNWQEYWTVLEVLRDAKHLDADTRFSMINLVEPSKDVVWKWSAGDSIQRSAFALVRQKSKTYKAVVDLVRRQLMSWTEIKDAQPNWLAEELTSMTDVVKKDNAFIEAMRRRGFEDLTFIDCYAVPPGYFGTEEQKNRRVARVNCQDSRGVRNIWARQIEGVTAIVDMNEQKVLRVVDEGVVPVPTVSADYDPTAIGGTREVPGPIRVEQPLGPGFRLNGYAVEWQKWRFRVRPDQRVGMIISTVTYDDGGKTRPILYQGHLSEIFVPYMDPSFAWYARNFLDAGEFTFGGLSKPLIQGQDCPGNAVYFDALVATDKGRPRVVPKTICMFERATGDPAWRHWDEEGGEGSSESRARRDLVVRTAAVLGNYDYVFDWIFQQNGSIQVAVGATGIAEVRMVAEQKARKDADYASSEGNGAQSRGFATGTERADAWGRFVAPQIVAVNHDHYFNFRLDLDVDGAANNLLIDRLKIQTLPKDHPRRSVWVRDPMLARQEANAKLHIDHEHPALWRVLSSSRTNHVGYPTSYQLLPGKNCHPMLSPDDYPRRRAGFINHHLWVTPYHHDERYAAGEYPTLSHPGQGLPAWTSQNRSIGDTDIVLWYTIGMHHMVRAEDWPVMPVLWHSFELRPFDFFDRNPALDLPR
jgi:primary-amine oxidase